MSRLRNFKPAELKERWRPSIRFLWKKLMNIYQNGIRRRIDIYVKDHFRKWQIKNTSSVASISTLFPRISFDVEMNSPHSKLLKG